MTLHIDLVLKDRSLSVDEKVRNLTAILSSLPNHGIDEILQFLFSSNDPAAATYAANYLALLPDYDKEKQKVVTYILDKKKDLMIAVVNLIRDMPAKIVDQLIDCYFQDPNGPAMNSVIYEVAMFFPANLRKFAPRITDETIRQAILPGGPDAWVEELVKSYRANPDPAYLRALGQFRTDRAIAAMLDLWPIIPEEDRWNLYGYIESSGVFPDSRQASVYFKTYRGRVVDRMKSPHHMGGEFPLGVPACAICDKPANRILTLKKEELDLEIAGSQDPTFFWINCPHPQDYVVARFTEAGVEGIMTATSPGPAATDLIPGNLALQLEEHPNQFGYGMDIIPGYGLHQVGGYPPWVTLDHFPRCPDCGEGMRYLATVDSGMTLYGELSLGGMLYGFWCEGCSISATLLQSG